MKIIYNELELWNKLLCTRKRDVTILMIIGAIIGIIVGGLAPAGKVVLGAVTGEKGVDEVTYLSLELLFSLVLVLSCMNKLYF